MSTIQLTIPDKANLSPEEVSRFLAAKLYEAGKLTLAQSAHMVNVSTPDFADILSKYGVSLFNYPASDISKDAAFA